MQDSSSELSMYMPVLLLSCDQVSVWPGGISTAFTNPSNCVCVCLELPSRIPLDCALKQVLSEHSYAQLPPLRKR